MGLEWAPHASLIVELVGGGGGGVCDNKLNEKQARWDTRPQSKGKEARTNPPLTRAHGGGGFWVVNQREAAWAGSLEETVWAEARRKQGLR